MTDLIIRPSQEADVPAIAEIYAIEVNEGTASFDLTPPDQNEMAHRRALLVESGYPYLVAEIGGAVAGYAYASPYRKRPAYRFSVENSVYVANWARRQGVGRALLKELVEQCEEAGFRQMVAVVGDSAHTASIGLHVELGFVLIGTIRDIGWKHDRWLDTVLLQRPLGPGGEEPAD